MAVLLLCHVVKSELLPEICHRIASYGCQVRFSQLYDKLPCKKISPSEGLQIQFMKFMICTVVNFTTIDLLDFK